jgi:hypothetical protein
VDRFARGVGPVSLLGKVLDWFYVTSSVLNINWVDCSSYLIDIGGKYDVNRKIEDLKLLYRAYVTNALAGGRMEDNKVNGLWLVVSFYYSNLK